MAQHRGEEALITGIAAGLTVEAAAKGANISPRTAFRRLADARFKRRVLKAREELLAVAVGHLARASVDAASVLEKGVASECETTRVKCAVQVLTLASRLHQDVSVAERLEAIEDALEWVSDAEATAGPARTEG